MKPIKKFALPGGAGLNTELIQAIVKAYTEHREWFYSNVEIAAVFDGFSGVWCGGRIFEYPEQTLEEIEKLVDFYNSRGVAFRQIFTNFYAYTFIDDQRCHEIMTILNKSGMNEVVLACDFTLTVLKEKYPNIKYISSVTKALLDQALFLKELKKSEYDMACVWISLHQDSFFDSIPMDLRSKVEIMPWQLCNPDCKYFYRCAYYINYEVLSHFKVASQVPRPTTSYLCTCPKNIHDAEAIFKLPQTMLNSDLDKLADKGYTNFKINGRVSPVSQTELMKLILYYVVDPEHYDSVLQYISQNYKNKSESESEVVL